MTHTHISASSTDAQLFELFKVCHQRKEEHPCAEWVLYAAERHIGTGRATIDFLERFNTLPNDQLADMVDYCLKHDLADESIIKSINMFLRLPKGKN